MSKRKSERTQPIGLTRFWRLTHHESMALQAMVRRVGLAPVLDDLSMLADEKGTNWQDAAAALYEAREEALKAVTADAET